jgi:hypothetical protein
MARTPPRNRWPSEVWMSNTAGGVEVRAEAGFVWAARRDRSAGCRFDHILALLPLAILEVVEAVLQQGELVRLDGHCARGVGDAAHALVNGTVLAAFGNA